MELDNIKRKRPVTGVMSVVIGRRSMSPAIVAHGYATVKLADDRSLSALRRMFDRTGYATGR